jgi:hypothetical protein
MAVVELTKENFEKVITSKRPGIIDYWAPVWPVPRFMTLRVAEQ